MEEKFYFDSWCQGFQSMGAWLHCCWAWGKAEHQGVELVMEQNCLPHGHQGTEEGS
jgi:hypothetical protein